MATNRIEHFVADMGAVHAAATPMSIYNTLSPEQVAFVAGHARPTVVILENADHRARWERALDEVDSITRVVMLDDGLGRPGRPRVRRTATGATRRRRRRGAAAAHPDSPATILYTSGTTGQPEGRRADPPQRALRGHLAPRRRPG